jgi:G3E family GTPase
LAQEGRFDHLVIESTGISEPLPVAETFTFADEKGVSLSDVATLDTMVTVVDAANFMQDFEEARALQETGEHLGEDDERSVADLLIEQVEFCDVILMNKIDLIDAAQRVRLKEILTRLNPEAELIAITHGQVSLNHVLGTGKFNFERAQQAPGWLKDMRGEHVPETQEYGIGSFVYTARRPFHPRRFYEFIHQDWPQGKLIRSKGYFWLASRPEFAGLWHQAGGMARHGFAGMFWKAVPPEKWPEDPEYRQSIMEKWEEPFGDMRQELVFIGQGLDAQQVREQLDACLLSYKELAHGKSYWKTLDDPFPAWER